MKERIETLITKEELEKRLDDIAIEIMKDFEGKTITLICVLKGAVMMMVDLSKRLEQNVEFDFMNISSYGDGTESTGIVKIIKDLDQPITGKDVLLVEDIVDTGRTLKHVLQHLQNQKPNSLKLCTLLDKPDRRVVELDKPDYTGFVIPDQFVVGYGLDYAQRYRNLPYIGIMHFDED